MGLTEAPGSGTQYPIYTIASGILICSGTSVPAEWSTSLPSLIQENITQTGTLSALLTAPTSSSTATSTFGSLTVGVAKQNTLGTNIIVNICVEISSGSGGVIAVGIGPTNSPSTDPVTLPISVATTGYFSFSVPDNYYILLTTSGTITLGSLVVQVTPL